MKCDHCLCEIHQEHIFRCCKCSQFVDCRSEPRLLNVYGIIKKEGLEKEKGPIQAGINQEIYRQS
jgi:hypothetical protein